MRCVNDYLEWFYRQCARDIYKHAWIFIIIPISITLILSTGFFLVNDRMVNDTIYLVTPYNGQWKYEKSSITEKWPYSDDHFLPGLSVGAKHWTQLIVTAKNGSTGLMKKNILQEILNLNDFIMNNFSLSTFDGYMDFWYGGVCLMYNGVCFGNGHVMALEGINSILLDPNITRMIGLSGTSEIAQIKYPITREYLTDDPFHVGFLFGGVKINETDGSILDLQAVRLLYFTGSNPTEKDTLSIQWRIGIQNYLLNQFQSDLINVAFCNEDSSNQGLLDLAIYYAPNIAVAFIIMLIFSFLNSFIIIQRKGFVGVDWIRSKPLLAFFGLTSPCLAIASSIGLMLLLGMPFHPFIVIIPFLILAIGVNDMFIMMSAWHSTKKTDPPEVRFAETLSEAAVSVTITSVSDVIAFAIGTWNNLPGLQLFAAYTSLGFFFELLYQCTYYAGAIALFAKMECDGRHCFTGKKTIALDDAKTTFQKRFLVGTLFSKRSGHSGDQQSIRNGVHNPGQLSHHTDLNSIQRLVRKYYEPALLRPCTKFIALLLFLIYIGLGIWGCTIMGNGLPPDNLVYKGHYSKQFLYSDYTYFQNGTPLQIVIGNPSNMSGSEGREEMLELVSAFENTPHSMGPSGTLFWLREYLKYLNESSRNIIQFQGDPWCDGIKQWLKMDTKGTWVNSVNWGNESNGENPCKITAFRLLITTINYGASEMSLSDAVPLFRNIADNYAKYNVTTYTNILYAFADQYLSINNLMIRNGVLAFVAMMVISMLMIPHPVCGLFIALSTASIDTGVAGLLGWWNVNMDGLTMTTMIMATGFAVDLSAHVSYAYIRSNGAPEERVRHALEELGWPVFQGVTSTLLGVLVLGLIDSYMYQVFFKTIFLVVVFGILHSLFFLPVALTVFAPRNFTCFIMKKRRTNANVVSNVTPTSSTNGSEAETNADGDQ